jgi:electron-transferring-flavoprotein dehydrogenase
MPSATPSLPTLLIAGLGDLGARVAAGRLAAGGDVVGLRRREHREAAPRLHTERVDLATGEGIARVPRHVDAVLFCVAPDTRDEAAYRALYVDGLRRLLDRVEAPRWLFVSSTAVYAQDAGEWVDEDSPAEAASFNGRVLRDAEDEMLQHAGGYVLRLSGLYGPGREALLQRAREGRAGARRWSNRIHVEDAASASARLLDLPAAAFPLRDAGAGTRVLLGNDDAPALECDVQAWVRAREGLPALAATDGAESGRRVRNARLRALGWVPAYTDFRAGYAALTRAGV